MTFNHNKRTDPRIGECPCRECEYHESVKYVCHAICGEYINWKRRHDEVNAEDRKARDLEIEATSYAVEKALKHKKIARARRGAGRSGRK